MALPEEDRTFFSQDKAFNAGSFQYVVVECEPFNGGIIQPDTFVFFKKEEQFCPLKKIDISVVGPKDWINFQLYGQSPMYPSIRPSLDTQDVLTEVLVPALKKRSNKLVLYPGRLVNVGQFTFQVKRNSPRQPGYFKYDVSQLSLDVDCHGDFKKIHISPFVDTVPTIYEHDVFENNLRPFIVSRPRKLYCEGMNFRFQGVEFHVVKTEPRYVKQGSVASILWKEAQGAISGPREGESHLSTKLALMRIGPETEIFTTGVVPPTIKSLLAVDQKLIIQRLPARLQPLATLQASSTLTPELTERVLNYVAMADSVDVESGSAEIALKVLQKYRIKDNGIKADEICSICFIKMDEPPLVELNCGHTYHEPCLATWFRNNINCPYCRFDGFLTEKSWWSRLTNFVGLG